MLVRLVLVVLLALAGVAHAEALPGDVPALPAGVVVPAPDRAFCYRAEGVCIERYDDFMRNKRAEEIGAGLLVSMFDRIKTLEGELAEAKNAKRCAVLEVLPSKKNPWRGM
jgi:hypothetical protein